MLTLWNRIHIQSRMQDTQKILQQKISLKEQPDSSCEIFTILTQTTVPLFPFVSLCFTDLLLERF